jgi:ADP-ribosylglycohydrolase
MLLEVALGDAYGIGFEFVKPVFIEKNHDMKQYRPSPFDGLLAGDYSDDTQMSIAISELMLSDLEWTPLNIANAFVNTFKRDQIKGYSRGFQDVLESSETGQDLLNVLKPESVRNGAAMRSVPLGYIRDIDELLEKSKAQAKITHNTQEGIFSSQAIALASHYFIYNIGPKEDVLTYLESKLKREINANKQDRCQCDAIQTVDAVITALIKCDSLYDIVDYAVKIGGDTDSVASIAAGIASTSSQYIKNLPDFMVSNLRNNEFGKDYIISLDAQLKEKYFS